MWAMPGYPALEHHLEDGLCAKLGTQTANRVRVSLGCNACGGKSRCHRAGRQPE
jgi:hypothetical protein